MITRSCAKMLLRYAQIKNYLDKESICSEVSPFLTIQENTIYTTKKNYKNKCNENLPRRGWCFVGSVLNFKKKTMYLKQNLNFGKMCNSEFRPDCCVAKSKYSKHISRRHTRRSPPPSPYPTQY